MTQVSAGVYESDTGDLCTADGTILIPKEKRQKAEVYSRVVGFQVKIESPEVEEGGDA